VIALAAAALPMPTVLWAEDQSAPALEALAGEASVPESSGTGYLVGSFAIGHGDYPRDAKNFHYNRYEFKYRQLNPDRGAATGILNAPDKALGDTPMATRREEVHGFIGASGKFLTNKYPEDFQFDGGSGTVFAVPLAVGMYEFYQYYVVQNGGTAQIGYKATKEFSILFEIKAGRATYVGEARAVSLFEKSLFGVRLADGARFDVHGFYERDAPLVKVKFPVLVEMPVDLAVLSAEADGRLPVGD